MSETQELDFEGLEHRPLSEFTEKAYLDYSMYVILDRALPSIGDDVFTIAFFDGTSDIVQSIAANVPYMFPAGGVGAFTVTGIEPGARLDPADPTAFVTGLSFVTNSSFTGTMTPITQFVAAPPTALLLAPLFVVALWRKTGKPSWASQHAARGGSQPVLH